MMVIMILMKDFTKMSVTTKLLVLKVACEVKCRSEKPALIGPGMKERLKGMFDYFG